MIIVRFPYVAMHGRAVLLVRGAVERGAEELRIAQRSQQAEGVWRLLRAVEIGVTARRTILLGVAEEKELLVGELLEDGVG
jgi:hypothetical protein